MPQENELTLLRSVAAHTHRRFKKVITFDYSTCSLDWQQAITQAVGLIDSPISTALPPMVLAVLVALEQGFNRNDHEELMDQIVQRVVWNMPLRLSLHCKPSALTGIMMPTSLRLPRITSSLAICHALPRLKCVCVNISH